MGVDVVAAFAANVARGPDAARASGTHTRRVRRLSSITREPWRKVIGALGQRERVGDTLYSARVYVKLGRRLAHAHATRQSCSDSLSQLVRDRRPAKSFTFTLGPL
jgi:hypothetical protein